MVDTFIICNNEHERRLCLIDKPNDRYNGFLTKYDEAWREQED